MTDQDKRAQLGEVLVSIEEAKTDLNHHLHRLKAIGRKLKDLSEKIETGEILLTGWSSIEGKSEFEALDRQEIEGLVDKIRELRKELERLKGVRQDLS